MELLGSRASFGWWKGADRVCRTGVSSKQGLISYPLVEVLVPAPEMCNACASCGTFESHKEGDEEPVRFKRCARCKQVSVRPLLLLSSFQNGADFVLVLQPLCEIFSRRSLLRFVDF